MGADDFVKGISTEKYVNMCRVSRSTAYHLAQCDKELGQQLPKVQTYLDRYVVLTPPHEPRPRGDL